MPLPRSEVLINDTVSSTLGGIRLAGVARFGRGVLVPNRILNRHSLVYVFDGSGVYTDDDVTEMPIRSGDVIQILPNTRHSYGPKHGRNWHEVYIIFEGPVFDVWHEEGYLELGSQVLPLKPIDYWHDQFMQAIGQPNDQGALGSIAEVLRVQALLLEIKKALQVGHQEDIEWLHAAKRALISVETGRGAAAEMGMGYEAFRKKFRKIHGMPPARYLANHAMSKACELLASTTYSVREISRRLDFCDEYHFSKRFSQIVGCSPSTYRARTSNH